MAYIYGNSGPNHLHGTAADDYIYGYEGNDFLDGGTGDDSLWGGAGNDIYIVDSQDDRVYEALDSGIDTVYAYVSDALDGNVENLYLYGTAITGTGNALDNKIAGNGHDNILKGVAGNDALFGYGGNDVLDGGTGDDSLWGGAGDDIYIVDSQDDRVYEAADAGIDTVYAYFSDTLEPNFERLYLYSTAIHGTGNALDNNIVGNGHDNILKGLAGDDILDGGTGDDSLWGGTGNDTYVVDSVNDRVYEALDGGNDTVQAFVRYTLNGNVENLYLHATASDGTGNSHDNVIAGNDIANQLKGLDGNDLLYGYEGDDVLDGGGGDDSLWGGTGNDTYYVDSMDDFLYEAEGAGTDTVYSYITYTLLENFENLSLWGDDLTGTGNDLDNVIDSSLVKNCTLYGLGGNDTLNGGNWKGYPTDGSKNILDGGDGNDTLHAVGQTNILIGGDGNDTLLGNGFDNTLIGGPGNDTLRALGSKNTLDGGDGNDTLIGGTHDILSGGEGDDILSGGDADDTLIGGSGNDILNGDWGHDTLIGGEGEDRFVFQSVLYIIDSVIAHHIYKFNNDDVISDYSHGDDTIVLKDYLENQHDGKIMGLSFTGGVLNAASYFEGPDYIGNGAEDSGIYNDTTTGKIWYNPTSNTSGDSWIIVTVGVQAAASLDNTDFIYAA